LLCIPIIAKNTEDALMRITEAEKQADITEIRLDVMDSFQLDTILNAAQKPAIVTYRSEMEGGMGKDDPSSVAEILMMAAKEKAAYIDVELSMPGKWIDKIIQHRGESRIIISTHIMDKTPSMDDLNVIVNNSISTGGDIVKIVTMAREWKDNMRLLELVTELRKRDIDIITFCMGALGRMSRVFSLLMGGYLTFTSLESGQESAPGQIPVNEMKRILEVFSV